MKKEPKKKRLISSIPFTPGCWVRDRSLRGIRFLPSRGYGRSSCSEETMKILVMPHFARSPSSALLLSKLKKPPRFVTLFRQNAVTAAVIASYNYLLPGWFSPTFHQLSAPPAPPSNNHRRTRWFFYPPPVCTHTYSLMYNTVRARHKTTRGTAFCPDATLHSDPAKLPGRLSLPFGTPGETEK